MSPVRPRPPLPPDSAPADRTRPRFSIVTAVYNVEPYLRDFIDSIEAQTFDHAAIEIVAVDDGSTDGSLRILEAWARSTDLAVSVLSQPNAGQGAARNRGLEHATGEWVTFTDPDDMLSADYFTVIDRFVEQNPRVELLSGRTLLLDEATGAIRNSHPRHQQYVLGNRVANLDHEPNVFTASAAGAVVRLDRVRALGLRFDTRIRPNFEDGHFVATYLLALRTPTIGLLRDADYIYRKRAADDSTLNRSMRDPGRYTAVFEHGYLDVFAKARARYGRIPEWLQQVVIYELSWYFSEDEKLASRIRMSEETSRRFHELLPQVVRQLDPSAVYGHRVRKLKSVWADILAFGLRDRIWHSPVASRTRRDAYMDLQRICYRYVGREPIEEFRLDGVRIEPHFAKRMVHSYYGDVLMHERVAWLPAAGNLELRLDGIRVGIRDGWPPVGRRNTRPLLERGIAYARTAPEYVLTAVRRRTRGMVRRTATRAAAWILRTLANEWPYRADFRDAWVLMDRIHDAGDNGERLFEYLVAERPDINAWFVLERDTPDWRRLRAAGVTRLVAHGSFTWTMLMLNARWLLSSHADQPVIRPPSLMQFIGSPTWHYAFLQHGVIKDDLSLWLNPKEIDLFVTSTPEEFDSVAGDETGYLYTPKETRNTGLPRFDRLLAKARAVAPADRRLVVIAPTWRSWLNLPLESGSQRRDVDDGFWDSDYYASWSALLASPEIHAAAERRGWRIIFMPHPNMSAVLPQMRLPRGVDPVSFTDVDAQDVYARTALLVTDYSSVAFNASYIDRPVVYFQFDHARMMNGEHVGRRGYFDYERDGFGPVATTLEDAVATIVASIEHGPTPVPTYQERIDATFTNRDGGACSRVVAAIEELSRPVVVARAPVRVAGERDIDGFLTPGQPG